MSISLYLFADTLFADFSYGAPPAIPEPLGSNHTSIAALEAELAAAKLRAAQYVSLEAEALSMKKQLLESRQQLSAVQNQYDGLKDELAALNSEHEASRIQQLSKSLKQQLANAKDETTALKSQYETSHSKAQEYHESAVAALQKQIKESALRLSELEAEGSATTRQLLEAQQQLSVARGEADQSKRRLLQLQQEREAAAATAESRKADAAVLEVTIAEMKVELAALQEQGGERVSELSAALAAARQRAQDQALQVRRLEAELRQATSQVESASQEHAMDRGALQEELRRVTAHASQLKDQVASLKSEYERSVGGLQRSLSEITLQNSKLEAEVRTSSLNAQEALRREKSSSSSLSAEVERLTLEIARHDEERSKLVAASEAARLQSLSFESCISDLRRQLAAMKRSDKEAQFQASVTAANERSADGDAKILILEGDIERLMTQSRVSAEEHARQLRNLASSSDEQKRRADAEATRCRSLADELKHLQLRLDNMTQDHAQALVSAQEATRRLQLQMQAQCDELQHKLSQASALSEEEASAHLKYEQAATASQAVAEILRKHLHEAQESVSEHLQRCNILEVRLNTLTAALDQKALDNERCKQSVAAAEARAREKDVEIRGLNEKMSNGRHEADSRVKDVQRQWEASEERATALEQQLHDLQQLLNAEKARRASDELVIGSRAAEVELLTSGAASAGQQLRAKDGQLLQLQDHAHQLQQLLLDADGQKAAMQQQLEAASHDMSTQRMRAEAERSMMQTAHATATSGLLAQVTCAVCVPRGCRL